MAMRKKSDKNTESEKASFWSTLPGILTGIATLITAVAGLLAILYNTGAIGNKTPPNNNASPNVNFSSNASTSPASDCFEHFFSGIAKDRIARVEAGAANVQVVGPNQIKHNAMGLKLTDGNHPFGALRFHFFGDNNLFKIEKIVDSNCTELEISKYRNLSRGGDNNAFQNWDSLQMDLEDKRYELRFGYDAGIISVNLQKVLK